MITSAVMNQQQIDVKDGVQLRAFYESLRAWLQTEYSSWMAHHGQLARYIMPRHQRFNYSSSDRGERMDQAIVDNTATIALRTLRAGLTAGICSPTRKWFSFQTNDPDLNKKKDVKIWLEEIERIVGETLLRSNFYQTAHTTFGELGLYGTSAHMILEDEKDGIRCQPWPIGSYYIAGDASNRIDLHLRVVQMTNRQMVDEFGYDNVSQSMQSIYNSNGGGLKEQWYPIVNVIHRARYFGGKQVVDGGKPWVSVWYEMGSYGNPAQSKDNYALLRKTGYWECPVIASRWDIVGEDFYGVSPAWMRWATRWGCNCCRSARWKPSTRWSSRRWSPARR